jgi:hypothetical protein
MGRLVSSKEAWPLCILKFIVIFAVATAAGAGDCFAQPFGQKRLAERATAANSAIPPGAGEQTADLGGTRLEVFTFRPAGCRVSEALLVFHGLERDARAYRDDAIPLGQRFCMLVIAPLFDKTRFPTWRYQRGGIVHGGVVQPRESWTVNLVAQLVSWVRRKENDMQLAYSLIGHSAGGQFLSRVAAFTDNDAVQTVIANPSTWVRPRLDIAAPYGFGGIGEGALSAAMLKHYLAAKITVLLGEEDVGSRNLATNEEAEEQGATRLARGQNVFREAAATARTNGWAFNWRLAMVPGAGHNARTMFGSDQAFNALRR